MVTVRVTFLGEMRSLAGRREMQVSLDDGSTVSVLLKYLCDSLGEDFRRHVFDENGNLYRHVSIGVNGSVIEKLDVLLTRLDGGEVDLMILPVFEGGQGREEGF